MNKLKSYLVATGCFVILVGVFTLMSPTVLQGDDDDGPNNVNVVNPPESPIPVVVQNGDADGAVELIEFVVEDLTEGQTQLLFTVPPGFRLVITDVTASNPGASRNFQRILRNVQIVFSLTLFTGSTFSDTFASGIQFDAGDELSVSNASTSTSFITWNLQGFLEAI